MPTVKVIQVFSEYYTLLSYKLTMLLNRSVKSFNLIFLDEVSFILQINAYLLKINKIKP